MSETIGAVRFFRAESKAKAALVQSSLAADGWICGPPKPLYRWWTLWIWPAEYLWAAYHPPQQGEGK